MNAIEENKSEIPEILSVITYPNSILKEISKEIEIIDDEVKKLIHNLFLTMYSEGGVGLSAIQCGIRKRVFVMDISNSGDKRRAFINPTIISGKNIQRYKEGCLSFPDVFAFVKRPSEISIKAMNESGEEIMLDLTGIEAICFQHEYDHLNGITFYDHLSLLQKHMIRKRISKLRK